MPVSVRPVFQSLISPSKMLTPLLVTANFTWLIHRAGIKNSLHPSLNGKGYLFLLGVYHCWSSTGFVARSFISFGLLNSKKCDYFQSNIVSAVN